MTNHKLFQVLLSATIISSASIALAQAAVDTPNNGAHHMQTVTPTPPAVTTTDTLPGEQHNAVPAISGYNGTQAPVTITNVPMDIDMSAPTTVVLEIPKADGTIIEKLINHHNNKEVEDIIAMFSKDGFIKVRNNGTIIKNSEDMRKELVDFFAGDKKHTFTSQVDMIKDIAPGVAIIGNYYNMFEEGNSTTNPKSKMYGITVVKYEDNAWKIIAQEATDLPKESALAEPAQHNGGGIKMTIVALIGIAIGFLGSRFLPKKNPQ